MKRYAVTVTVIRHEIATLVVEASSENDAKYFAEEIVSELDYEHIDGIAVSGFTVDDESLEYADVHKLSTACKCYTCKAHVHTTRVITRNDLDS
jgi:regulator of RNase E activity RraB